MLGLICAGMGLILDAEAGNSSRHPHTMTAVFWELINKEASSDEVGMLSIQLSYS